MQVKVFAQVELIHLEETTYADKPLDKKKGQDVLDGMEKAGIPFVVDGTKIVIGHFRIEMLRRLGHDKIWAVDLGVLPEKFYYIIIHHRRPGSGASNYQIAVKDDDSTHYMSLVRNMSYHNLFRITEVLNQKGGIER